MKVVAGDMLWSILFTFPEFDEGIHQSCIIFEIRSWDPEMFTLYLNAMFPHLSLHGNVFPHLFGILSDAGLVPTPLFSDLRHCENRDRGVQCGPKILWQDHAVLLHETHWVILPGCGVDLPNGYSENKC